MRWLAVTAAFLAASAALVAGIYLRDRVADPKLPGQRSLAHHEAVAVLESLAGSHCAPCGVALLSKPRAGHWVARITTPQSVQCIDINLTTFTWDRGRGFSGITAVSCTRAQPASHS